MTIHDRIIRKQIEFEADTGTKPENVYLGRIEMQELINWAHKNYIGVTDKPEIEDDSRPEVNGVFVYKVDDDNHLCCA